MARKVKRKQKQSQAGHRSPPQQPPSNKLLRSLDEVYELTRNRQWSEAIQQLQALNHRYPNRPEVLSELVDVARYTGDAGLYARYAHELHQLRPSDPDAHYAAATAYLASGFPGLAYEALTAFLERHPDQGFTAEAKERVAELEEVVPELVAQFDLADTDPFAVAARHDEIRFYLQGANYDSARRVAREVMESYPTFAPAYNNLSQAEALVGNYDEAIRLAKQVLAFDANNFQALANLARYSHLLDDAAAVEEYLSQLHALALTENAEYQLKVLETLSVLGRDEAVLTQYKAMVDDMPEKATEEQALMHHFAAVSALLLEDEQSARTYWQAALAADPSLTLAEENLADLAKPVGQRNAPWLYPLNHWLPRQTLEELIRLTTAQSRGRQQSDKATARAMQRFFDTHPALKQTLPILLERGDPQGREFAVKIIDMGQIPEQLAQLHAFALSKHGADELRVEAMNIAVQAGLQPSGMATLWIDGEWRELMLMNYEIHGEQLHRHSRRVTEWMNEGLLQTRRGNYTEAEDLLHRALAAEPNSPDILNNLAVLYETSGQSAKTKAVAQQIFTEFPDYLFGQIARARELITAGDTEEARQILAKVAGRSRLHYTEFDALCAAHIQLMLATDQVAGAQTWLDMWRQANTDSPHLQYWQDTVNAAKES